MRHFFAKLAAILAAFAPWDVLALSLLDSMGVPLPSALDFMLIGVGAESVHTPSRAYFSALLAVVGSTIGNVLLFQAARHGRRLFSRRNAELSKPGKFTGWFHRYGLLTVFIPAVTPVVPLPLKVFVISAGALHTPFSRFVLLIVVARLLRYFGLAYLGIQLGADARGFLIRNGWTLAGVALAIAFALYFVIRAVDRERNTLAETSPQ